MSRRPLLTSSQARRFAQAINEQRLGYRHNTPKMLLTLACRERERIEDEKALEAATKEVWE
jgi:hypothetical protein